MDDFLWWRDGVIYQVYPRSFCDTNGDGLGDLPGITSRLDYLAGLGVDAIWLSPFYPTPDADFGYDISDHTAVDPRFGALEDFDTLVREAHRRGLRVVLDLALNHTSDRHPWFIESRSGRDHPKRDWFIWRRPRPGRRHAPPNNWQASFGGTAWEYDAASGEVYLHLFTRQQPDVNWRNPDLRQAQLDVVRFWLERGVDGFRLDVFNAYFKDERLRSNPFKPGLRAFDRQVHLHDMDQPEMAPLLAELRTILDGYPERYAVGETYLSTPDKAASYCGAEKLHAAFSFDFIRHVPFFPWTPGWIVRQLLRRDASFDRAGVWPTTVLGNHDQRRTASRYGRGEDDRMAKIAMTILLTVRGTPFMYYGEEIGMRNLRLRRSELMDPPGVKYWPLDIGRDGCRTPMQWDATPGAGFSSGRPWIRLHPNAAWRNVAIQDGDPGSLLNFTRQLLALRRASPALQRGEFVPPARTPPGLLVYQRRSPAGTVLVALNFTRWKRRMDLPPGAWRLALGDGRLISENPARPGRLELPPLGLALLDGG
ncbi:MAG: alpha-glucosidase [Chloroflexi bacterium]|nr:alpha-glucosidase [Chloroflexota bacterium]